MLERLVPPLVHRANNALAVVQGVLELGERAGARERELGQRELHALGALLARLAALAREPSTFEGSGDLRALELLLLPLADSLGVRLELRDLATGLCVPMDARLETLWLVLAAERVLLLGERPVSAPRRVRIRLAQGAGRARLTLSADEPLPGFGLDPSRGATTLEELRRLAGERGWRLGVRAGKQAWSARLELPLGTEMGQLPAAGPASVRRARVFLLQAEGELRELSATVLREHGLEVVEGGAWPVSGEFELVLIDGELARGEPELLAHLRRDPRAGRTRLACLGRWPGTRSSPPVLEKPFRPRQLLEFVEERLAEPLLRG